MVSRKIEQLEANIRDLHSDKKKLLESHQHDIEQVTRRTQMQYEEVSNLKEL